MENHSIFIEERKRMTVTGVTDVDGFNEELVKMNTVNEVLAGPIIRSSMRPCCSQARLDGCQAVITTIARPMQIRRASLKTITFLSTG